MLKATAILGPKENPNRITEVQILGSLPGLPADRLWCRDLATGVELIIFKQQLTNITNQPES